MVLPQIIVIFLLALTIFLICDAYRKHSELKKFKTGIIIAVVIECLAIVATAISLVLSLNK
ncbi:MAG: hypothetical protein LBC73_00525 [Oscillospiraceae bacterium]|nr:hypothetical protein [Oscillospiraceae bacterium]